MIRTLTLSLILFLTAVNAYSQQPFIDNTASSFSHNTKMGNYPPLLSNTFSSLNSLSLPRQYVIYDSLYTFDSINQIIFKHVRTYNSQLQMTNEMIYKHVNGSFINFQKIEYTVNTSTNSLQITTQKRENNFWINSNRWSYYYDSVGRVTKTVYELENLSGILDSSFICYRIYNSIGKISEISRFSNYNYQWHPNEKSQVTYDASGRINCVINYTTNNGQFGLNTKDSIYYNSNNDITKQVYFTYTSGNWFNYIDKKYTYTTSGVLTLTRETRTSWNSTENLRSIFTYNPSGLILQINTQKLDNFVVWQNWKQKSFTYNTSGQLISAKSEMYKNNSWLNDDRYKFDFTYDANGNIATQIYSNSVMNIWMFQDKISNSFDNFNRSLTGEGEHYQNNSWVLTPSVLYLKDSTNIEETIGAIRYLAFYVPNTAGLSLLTHSNNKITLYPNPAHSEISIIRQKGTFNNAEIRIYDISGKLLIHKNYNFGDNIDISGLYKGVYLVQIKTDLGIQARRFIKE